MNIVSNTNVFNKNSMEKDKFQIYSSVAFMIIVIIFGIPMWWKTTEVYRSILPDNIKNLESKYIEISSKVFIYTSEKERLDTLVNEIEKNFSQITIFNVSFVKLCFESSEVKTPAALEKLIKRTTKIRPGDFLLITWNNQKEDVLITSERTAYISQNATSKKISQVLLLNILKLKDILKIINEDKSDRMHGTPSLKQHNVVISVLNPEPTLMQIEWNVKEAVQLYLDPFLKYINPISNFTLKTQFKYQVPFKFTLKQIRDSSKLGRHYSLKEEELPHIITLIEKNLGFITSDNPIINLVVYVPPCEISPLHIYRDNEDNINQMLNDSIESFSSPKWGGVLIHNPPITTCEQYQEKSQRVTFNVNSKNVMQALLFQLQKFYELNTYVDIDAVRIEENESLHPLEWQFDAYVRRTTVSQILTTVRTLQSLVQLLESISYIVINDDVGTSINNAYQNVVKAKKYLKDGKLLEAMKYASEAFISSERAFFDSSLLAQLYFPDEQKYAIYIPLFLPIMVPVITSLVMIAKWYIKPKKEKIKGE